MTAEIAILNKGAVALAADSAVTITTGDKEEKTFDSADKLFELCRYNPIGIMVYNGLSFAETPLQSLIKQYRSECPCFDKVDQAVSSFLEYLNKFGVEATQRVKDDSIRAIVNPLLQRIAQRFQSEFQEKILAPSAPGSPDAFRQLINEISDKIIGAFERIYGQAPPAQFVGGEPPVISEHIEKILVELSATHLPLLTPQQRDRLLAIAKLALHKNILSGSATGIVISGFGNKDLFPTLVSFEIDGMVGDKLKFIQTNSIKIDRDGEKARVIPFAQKEMVDRFLYGLDDGIERSITSFCKRTVPDIRKVIFERIDFPSDADKATFEQAATAAEDAFVAGLGKEAFNQIRTQSKAAIDGMVEFMPKPELAKMAEALVNLTSIKKRVTRGMDTVGGPIDVAVISHAEGFVWVKRKHYFPGDLNPRYLARVHDRVRQDQEQLYERRPSSRGPRPGDRTKASKARKTLRRSPKGDS